MEITFNGKRALVTGAGKGIGRVIVIELMKCGAQVVALSRTQSDLDSLKAEYPQVEIVLCDLADLQESNKIIAGLGDFDLLVNNAAIAKCGSFLDTKCSDVADMMNINVNAVINVSQVVVRSMIRRGVGGAIVNISSQASMAALADHVGYAATKGALDSATRVMACELGPKNIRVNAVNPTVITTDMSMAGWSDPARAAWMKERIPLGRFGDPIEVAQPVLFLLSDKASMINGTTIPIDGGFTAC